MRLSHVCFSTANIEKTVTFYGEVFGFQVVHEFRNDQGELYGVFIALGPGSYLEFFSSAEPVGVGNQFRHFCLEVEDINSVARMLKAKGYEIEVKRGKTDGALHCWFEDPNGIRIEFHQAGSASFSTSQHSS